MRGAGLPSQRAEDAGARHWRDDGPKVDSPLDWVEAGGAGWAARGRLCARAGVFAARPKLGARGRLRAWAGIFATDRSWAMRGWLRAHFKDCSHHTQKQKTAAPVVEAEALASHGLKINSSEDCGLGINPSSHAVFL